MISAFMEMDLCTETTVYKIQQNAAVDQNEPEHVHMTDADIYSLMHIIYLSLVLSPPVSCLCKWALYTYED